MSFQLIQDVSKKSNNQNSLLQNKTGYVKHDYIDSLFDIPKQNVESNFREEDKEIIKNKEIKLSDIFGSVKTNNEVLDERHGIDLEKNKLPFKIDYNDIPKNIAMNAYNGRSWTPERRAHQEQNSYVKHFIEFYNKIKPYITEENKYDIINDIERYKQGFLKHKINLLHSSSRIVSSVISGGSNYPQRTMQKRMDSEHNKEGLFYEYINKVENAILKKYNPHKFQTIKTGENETVNLLKKKLSNLEAHRDRLKEINKIAKKNKGKNISKWGLTDNEQTIVLKSIKYGFTSKPDKPIELFTFSNLSQEINRLKKRIIGEENLKEIKTKLTDKIEKDGISFEINNDINRVQLKFPGKPTKEIINKLKHNGFHWSPREAAWQRQSTQEGIRNAKFLFKEFTGLEI